MEYGYDPEQITRALENIRKLNKAKEETKTNKEESVKAKPIEDSSDKALKRFIKSENKKQDAISEKRTAFEQAHNNGNPMTDEEIKAKQHATYEQEQAKQDKEENSREGPSKHYTIEQHKVTPSRPRAGDTIIPKAHDVTDSTIKMASGLHDDVVAGQFSDEKLQEMADSRGITLEDFKRFIANPSSYVELDKPLYGAYIMSKDLYEKLRLKVNAENDEYHIEKDNERKSRQSKVEPVINTSGIPSAPVPPEEGVKYENNKKPLSLEEAAERLVSLSKDNDKRIADAKADAEKAGKQYSRPNLNSTKQYEDIVFGAVKSAAIDDKGVPHIEFKDPNFKPTPDLMNLLMDHYDVISKKASAANNSEASLFNQVKSQKKITEDARNEYKNAVDEARQYRAAGVEARKDLNRNVKGSKVGNLDVIDTVLQPFVRGNAITSYKVRPNGDELKSGESPTRIMMPITDILGEGGFMSRNRLKGMGYTEGDINTILEQQEEKLKDYRIPGVKLDTKKRHLKNTVLKLPDNKGYVVLKRPVSELFPNGYKTADDLNVEMSASTPEERAKYLADQEALLNSNRTGSDKIYDYDPGAFSWIDPNDRRMSYSTELIANPELEEIPILGDLETTYSIRNPNGKRMGLSKRGGLNVHEVDRYTQTGTKWRDKDGNIYDTKPEFLIKRTPLGYAPSEEDYENYMNGIDLETKYPGINFTDSIAKQAILNHGAYRFFNSLFNPESDKYIDFTYDELKDLFGKGNIQLKDAYNNLHRIKSPGSWFDPAVMSSLEELFAKDPNDMNKTERLLYDTVTQGENSAADFIHDYVSRANKAALKENKKAAGKTLKELEKQLNKVTSPSGKGDIVNVTPYNKGTYLVKSGGKVAMWVPNKDGIFELHTAGKSSNDQYTPDVSFVKGAPGIRLLHPGDSYTLEDKQNDAENGIRALYVGNNTKIEDILADPSQAYVGDVIGSLKGVKDRRALKEAEKQFGMLGRGRYAYGDELTGKNIYDVMRDVHTVSGKYYENDNPNDITVNFTDPEGNVNTLSWNDILDAIAVKQYGKKISPEADEYLKSLYDIFIDNEKKDKQGNTIHDANGRVVFKYEPGVKAMRELVGKVKNHTRSLIRWLHEKGLTVNPETDMIEPISRGKKDYYDNVTSDDAGNELFDIESFGVTTASKDNAAVPGTMGFYVGNGLTRVADSPNTSYSDTKAGTMLAKAAETYTKAMEDPDVNITICPPANNKGWASDKYDVYVDNKPNLAYIVPKNMFDDYKKVLSSNGPITSTEIMEAILTDYNNYGPDDTHVNIAVIPKSMVMAQKSDPKFKRIGADKPTSTSHYVNIWSQGLVPKNDTPEAALARANVKNEDARAAQFGVTKEPQVLNKEQISRLSRLLSMVPGGNK